MATTSKEIEIRRVSLAAESLGWEVVETRTIDDTIEVKIRKVIKVKAAEEKTPTPTMPG